MSALAPRPLFARPNPLILGTASAVLAAGAVVGSLAVFGHGRGPHEPKAPTVAEARAMEQKALLGAAVRPGLAMPVSMPVKVLPGETLQSAVQRTGVAAGEAKAVVDLLSRALDTVHIKAGLAFQAAIAHPRGQRGPARLVGLSMMAGPASTITVSRTFDGALKLRELQERVSDNTTVAEGHMQGSLYESAVKAGADSRLVSEAAKLFSHKIDFARDLHPSDQFKLVFDRKVTDSGRTVATGDLLYAELAAKGQTTRFYRFDDHGKTDFFDELGKNIKGFLLRTPLDSVRITSGFGMRMHPLLGYTRMHAGIDFGAPVGTPVYAAGAGVIKEERWAGGYGHWLKIEHEGGWATGYGHLSAYARGLHVGEHVAQGQVVAYVGSTGLSTGPHLHYEVMHGSEKLNPASAKVPQGTVLAGRDLAAFRTQKAHIDALLTRATEKDAPPVRTAALDPRQPAAGSIRGLR
jgi:murein DD-endopeptidase MepM/ murein hydrolase activator NlpD